MAVSERVREVVEQQVRTAIRNDGLDPLAQPERFRALVEQCAVDAWITHGASIPVKLPFLGALRTDVIRVRSTARLDYRPSGLE